MSPSYVAAKAVRGIDLRLYGSGTVSGSNVWRSVARWAVVPVGMIEVLKGVGAVLVARALGLDVWWQMMAGCIVIVGHNWSMLLGFSGGRGFGVSIGVMLLVAPKELVVLSGVSLLGFLAEAGAPAMGLGMATTPLASHLFGDPTAVTAGCGIIAFLMFAKRLTGDPGAGESGLPWKNVLLNRFLFDRDIRNRRGWLERRPQ
jgi:glycerol-3-phosphate acyltransferase PlsY